MQIHVLTEDSPDVQITTVRRRGGIVDEKTLDFISKQIPQKSASLSIKIETLPSELSLILPNENLLILKKKQTLISGLSALLSLIIIIFSYLAAEEYYLQDYTLSPFITSCRFIIMASSLTQDALIFFYYSNHLRIKKAYKEISEHTTLFEDPYIKKQIIFEIFVSMPFIPPFAEWHGKFYQLNTYAKLSLDDFFLVFSFLRFTHVVKFMYEFSINSNPKTKFYCSLQNTKSSISFTLKWIMRTAKFLSIFVVSAGVTLLCGMLLRTFEKGIPDTKFSYFWNSFWNISITEATVGYGEYVPLSHLGRIICVSSAIYGMFMYSLIIINVNEKVKLSDKELLLYKRMKYKHKIARFLAPISARLIQKWWRLDALRKKGVPRLKEAIGFHVELKRFRYEKTLWHSKISSSLEEQIRDVVKISSTKLIAITKYLEGTNSFQQIGGRFVSNEYSTLNKLLSFKTKLEKLTNKEPTANKNRIVAISRYRKSSTANASGDATPRRHMKMLGELAVKKMIQSRIDSHGSFSNISNVSNRSSRRSSNVSINQSSRSSISRESEGMGESV
ncbi:unnamed protein product [Blepharisma stoltei]|uniref:Potassium channel domain-containing protein n=1 Tax=Blepharisma stoltei TaxID=1481888 RepID=A0AAU9ISP6_9CILI|nr:unnamed protein product [Blepharisma stoltei]